MNLLPTHFVPHSQVDYKVPSRSQLTFSVARPGSAPLVGKRIPTETKLQSDLNEVERFVPTPVPFQINKPKAKAKPRLREPKPKLKAKAVLQKTDKVLAHISNFVEKPKDRTQTPQRKKASRPRARSTLANAVQAKSAASIKSPLEPQLSLTPTKKSKYSCNELVRQSLKKQKDLKIHAQQVNELNTQSIDERRSVLQHHNIKIRLDNKKCRQAQPPTKFAWGVDQTKFKVDDRAKRDLNARKERRKIERARAHSAGKARIGMDVLTEIKLELAAKTRSKSSAGRYTEEFKLKDSKEPPRRPKSELISFIKSKQDDIKIRYHRDQLEEQAREVKRISQLTDLHNQEKQRLTKFKKKKHGKSKRTRKATENGTKPKLNEELEVLQLVRDLNELSSTFEVDESSRFLVNLTTEGDEDDEASNEVRKIMSKYHKPIADRPQARVIESATPSKSQDHYDSLDRSSDSIAKRKEDVKKRVSDLRRKVDQTKQMFANVEPKVSASASVASLVLPVIGEDDFVDILQQVAAVKIQSWVRRYLVRCQLERYLLENSQNRTLSHQYTEESEMRQDTHQSEDTLLTIESADYHPKHTDSSNLDLSLPKQFQSKDKHYQHILLEELSSMKEREAELEDVISQQQALLQEREEEELIRKSQIFDELKRLRDREMQIVMQVADKSGSQSLAGIFAEFISKRYQHLELLFKENHEALQAEIQDSEFEWIEANLGSRGKRGSYEKIEVMLDKIGAFPKKPSQKVEGLIPINPKPLSSSLQPFKKNLNLALDLDDSDFESVQGVESAEDSKIETTSITTDRYLAQFNDSQDSRDKSMRYKANLADAFMTDSEGDVERLVSDLSAEISEQATERSIISVLAIRNTDNHVETPSATCVSDLLFKLCHPQRQPTEDVEPVMTELPFQLTSSALEKVAHEVADLLIDNTVQLELQYLAVEEVALTKHRIYVENQRLSDLLSEEIMVEIVEAELDILPGMPSEMPFLELNRMRKRSSFWTMSSVFGIDTSPEAVAVYVQEVLTSLDSEVVSLVFDRVARPPVKDWVKELEGIVNELPEEPLDFHSTPAVVPIQAYLALERARKESITDRSQLSQTRLTEQEADQIHNKMLFDCINEALLKLQLPPAFIPWKVSLNRLAKEPMPITELFYRVSDIVTEWSLTEAGKIPSFDLLMSNGKIDEELLQHQREDRLTHMIYTELLEQDSKWVDYFYEETQVKLDLADLMLSKLVEETVELLSL